MIDSENIYTVVTNELLAPYGKEMTWAIKAGIMGRPAVRPSGLRCRPGAYAVLPMVPHSPTQLVT
jgi:hypothetical protein